METISIRLNNQEKDKFSQELSNLLGLKSKKQFEKQQLPAIVNFIFENQLNEFIFPVLLRIFEYYPECKIKLDLHQDSEESYETLFFIIKTRLNQKSAFQQQMQLFKHWDLLKNPLFSRFITISTESI